MDVIAHVVTAGTTAAASEHNGLYLTEGWIFLLGFVFAWIVRPCWDELKERLK